ncbi:MAG: DUF1761 domain-containing protein [Spirochaetales bacterium]
MDFSVFLVNIWAVLVSGVAYFAIGAFWYGAFSKPWMAGIGKTAEELQSQASDYIVSLICEIGIAFAVAIGLNAFGAASILDAIFVATLLWFGFSLLPTIVHYAYEDKTFSLLAINKGYDLVGMIVASIILAVW